MWEILQSPIEGCARRLWPNQRDEVNSPYAASRDQVVLELLRLMGMDGMLVGWNVQMDLMALRLAVPAIRVLDLAVEPTTRALYETSKLDIEFALEEHIARLQLPRIITRLTRERMNIRYRKSDLRDAVIDALAIAALWRKVGFGVLGDRQNDTPKTVALAGNFVGMGEHCDWEWARMVPGVPWPLLLLN